MNKEECRLGATGGFETLSGGLGLAFDTVDDWRLNGGLATAALIAINSFMETF